MARKYKKNPSLLILIVLTTACVDRITIKVPVLPSALFTVDGLITDEPGPYTIQLTSAIRVDGGLTRGGEAISVKKITLYDDIGNEEILSEITQGTYQTKPDGIRGKIGREYHIRIEANDGTIYESLPDKMNPVGEVDTIYHRFQSFQPTNSPTEYGYRISIDAHDLLEARVILGGNLLEPMLLKLSLNILYVNSGAATAQRFVVVLPMLTAS